MEGPALGAHSSVKETETHTHWRLRRQCYAGPFPAPGIPVAWTKEGQGWWLLHDAACEANTQIWEEVNMGRAARLIQRLRRGQKRRGVLEARMAGVTFPSCVTLQKWSKLGCGSIQNPAWYRVIAQLFPGSQAGEPDCGLPRPVLPYQGRSPSPTSVEAKPYDTKDLCPSASALLLGTPRMWKKRDIEAARQAINC